MISYLFNILFLNIFSLIIVLFVGLLLSKYFVKIPKIYSNIFLQFSWVILIGFLTTSALVAICVTKGQTIFWGIIIALLFIKFNQKKENTLYAQVRLITFLTKGYIPLIFLTICFLIVYLITGSPVNKYELAMDHDFYYYSKLSQKLMLTGVENRWSALLSNYTISDKISLYHYGDLYFNGFIKIFNNSLNFSSSLLYVTNPLIIITTLLGFSGYIIKTGYKKHLVPVILFFIIFGTKTVFNQFESSYYALLKSFFNYNFFISKNLIIFPIIFHIIFTVSEKKFTYITGFTLFGCVTYSPLIPPLVGALGGVVLILLFFEISDHGFRIKNYSNKFKYIFFQLLFIVFAVLCIIYMTQNNETLNNINIERSILTKTIMFFEYVSMPFVSSFGFSLILSIIAYSRKISFSFFYMFFSLLSATFFIMVFHETPDVRQSLALISPPLIFSFLVISIKELTKAQLKFALFFLIAGTIINITQKNIIYHSKSYHSIAAINFESLQKNKDKTLSRIAVIGPENAEHVRYTYSPVYYPLMNLDNLDYPIDMSFLFYSHNNFYKGETFNRKLNIFNDSYMKNLNTNEILSFFKRNNMKYLFFYKNKNYLRFNKKNLKKVFQTNQKSLYEIL